MQTLREYRKKANLSQPALAEILKTTRSQIAMAERGDRPLPKQSLKLFQVMQSLGDVYTVYAKGFPLLDEQTVPADEALNFWQAKAAQNRWEIHGKKKKLAQMEAEYASLTAQYLEFQKQLVAIPQTGGNDIEVNYFKDKQKRLSRKILSCGQIVQLRLQLSIDLLLAEADLLNQYVASATGVTATPM